MLREAFNRGRNWFRLATMSPSSLFRGGAGLTPYNVDCSASPLDLRPAADVIVRAARDALARIDDDVPLVVIMGETHSMSAHVEMKHIVASRFLNEPFGQTMTVNFEQTHNYLAKIMREGFGMNIPDHIFYRIGEGDPDGSAVLSSHIACSQDCFAPQAAHDAVNFCYSAGIRAQFSDAARIRFDLDRRDPLTRQIAADRGLDIDTMDTNAELPHGMALRNAVMASRALSHARQSDARVIVQFTGLNHVFGNHSRQYRYEDSLCAAFQDAGAHVLPVFVTTRDYNSGVNDLPPESYGQLSRSVIVDGLSEKEFFSYEYSLFRELPFMPGAEERFIRRIHEKSGGELEFFDRAAHRAEYLGLVMYHATEVLDFFKHQARAAVPNRPPVAGLT